MASRRFVPAVLLLCLTSACADLDVANPNDPDIERVFSTPDVAAAAATSSVLDWWKATTHYEPLNML